MTFGIVILTLNSENKISKLLKLIKKQTVQPYEILIIDSDSSDKTREVSESFGCRVLKISRNEFDHGGTRTLGAEFLNSEVVIYLTDDVLPADDNVFLNLMDCFKDEKIGAVFARQIPYSETNVFGKHLRAFNYPKNSYVRSFEDRRKYGIKAPFLSNSFCAYRKSKLEKIGFFKDCLILGEDTYAGAKILKAGYKIAYCADARVYHSHNYTMWQEFKRYFDIGVFHKSEEWILTEFGKAEGEGIRYIFSGIKYLWNEQKIYLLPEFFIRIFFKYLGYKLGYIHRVLPHFLIKLFSMHKRWWIKKLR